MHDELTNAAPVGTFVETDVPTRLDRMAWSRWHWRIVGALGFAWVLDGLEASLVNNLGPVLCESDTLALTPADVGHAHSVYLIGQVLGALTFGYWADRLGRKRLFLATLAVYLVATVLSGLAPNFVFFMLFRFVAGAGIGGEIGAMNSAIDELIPARVRGHVDLGINSGVWFGVMLSAVLSTFLLDPTLLPHRYGWRLAFALGGVLGIAVLVVRRAVPESPRWLVMRGRLVEADQVVRRIELEAGAPVGVGAPKVRVRVAGAPTLAHVVTTLLRDYRGRTALGLGLMVSQAFFYNSVSFSNALVLNKFYAVGSSEVGRYQIPFAVGNLLGPIVLGRFFDKLGRRPMITATYALAGLLLAASGVAFWRGWLTTATQVACWAAIFFVASAAAGSAYLTVSELFPAEMRAISVSIFYAIAQASGALAPSIFGAIIASGSRQALFVAYLADAGLMVGAALVALTLGVAAEGKSLEDLCPPTHDPA